MSDREQVISRMAFAIYKSWKGWPENLDDRNYQDVLVASQGYAKQIIEEWEQRYKSVDKAGTGS